MITPNLEVDVIEHHLQIFGLGKVLKQGIVAIYSRPNLLGRDEIERCVVNGGVAVIIQAEVSLLESLGVKKVKQVSEPGGIRCYSKFLNLNTKLKSLHPCCSYLTKAGQAVVQLPDGTATWIWVQGRSAGGYLIVGTDISRDLVRYRQGDPRRADGRPTEALWGIPGERPNFLFEEQLSGEEKFSRQADYWIVTLKNFLELKLNLKADDVLPNDAPGAIVITGDDDQAYLEKYDQQLKLLGDLPITYLLHPLTRHTRRTLQDMTIRNPGVDFGIHPDALEAPNQYAEIFDKQVKWYRKLTGKAPVSLRNHGFLNDGYWGHGPAWIKHNVKLSSNLPGLDGKVLNGSLLPARLVLNGRLTTHWSVLTALGDGMRFAAGMTDAEAAENIVRLANEVRESRIPGVIVINLHPQNFTETIEMHLAIKELVARGFMPWNLRQCWNWFANRNAETNPEAPWYKNLSRPINYFLKTKSKNC